MSLGTIVWLNVGSREAPASFFWWPRHFAQGSIARVWPDTGASGPGAFNARRRPVVEELLEAADRWVDARLTAAEGQADQRAEMADAALIDAVKAWRRSRNNS